MGIGVINYLTEDNPAYAKGFADGYNAKISDNRKKYLGRSDASEAYKLLNRIRIKTKDAYLSKEENTQRMIDVFNATQELLMQKGLI